MRNVVHRIAGYLGQFNPHSEDGQESGPALPVKMVAAASFVWLLTLYSLTKGWVALHSVLWMDYLVFGFLPLALIFSILYPSGWHRDRRIINRCGSLFLRAVALYGGVLLAIGFMTFLAAFFVMVFAAGEGPG